MDDKDGKIPAGGNPFEIRKITIRSLTGGEARLVAGGWEVTQYQCTYYQCDTTNQPDFCNSDPDFCDSQNPAYCPTGAQCTHNCTGGACYETYWCGGTLDCDPTTRCTDGCTQGQETCACYTADPCYDTYTNCPGNTDTCGGCATVDATCAGCGGGGACTGYESTCS